MRLGGLQRTSLIDYPGHVAAVVFTQGCAFRCDFCHNPELVIPEQFQQQLDENKFFEWLDKRKLQIDGVAVSGGDPSIQPDLPNFLTKIKALGLKTKLDTTGVNPALLERLIASQLVDYFAMDVKAPLEHYTDIIHNPIPAHIFLRSIRTIMQSGIDYEFRTTIARSQLSFDDLLAIGKTIQGARHYFLQRFIPSKTLNPAFIHETSYTKNELEPVRLQLESLVQHCSIR